MKGKISIVTINYNGLKDTCELIETIPVSEWLEVIVVDNESQADEAAILKSKYPHVHVVRSEENLGFAGGNNLGFKAATGDYLFFINNDTVFEGTDKQILSSFQSLVNRLESDERIGIVCPKIRFSWENRPIQFTGYTPLSPITLRNQSIGFGEEDRGQYDIPHESPYAHGAAMLVKRSAIDLAGQMPENFFLYYEELDWSMMMRRAGYQIWYDPCCTIYHKESQSTGQHSPLRMYYITRNRLLFAQRNISGMQKYLTYAYLILGVGIRDLMKNIIQGKTDLAKATARGIGDFLRHKQQKM